MHPLQEASHRDALAAKAYSAAGQVTSALHAMALLQVYQTEELKEMHEGSADPGLMQKLCTVTDLALPATKVTVRSLGQTMSTLGVQEHHLWLNLAEMREVDKVRFLPHLPDRLIRRRCRELYPAVLSTATADEGDQAHPAPTRHCCQHLSRAAPPPARRQERLVVCRNSPATRSSLSERAQSCSRQALTTLYVQGRVASPTSDSSGVV